jgi:hypothetical protein
MYDNNDLFLQPKVTQYNNHMVMTNVHKETKKKHWNIDTRFRDDYDNYDQTTKGSLITGYTFTLPQSINDVKSIQVNNAEIPLSFYNISTALGNNSMFIGNTTTNKLITIPDGFYNPVSLTYSTNSNNTSGTSNSIPFKTAVNTALATISGVSFDISSNGVPKTIFTNTSGSKVDIAFPIKPSNTCGGNLKPESGTADFDKHNFKSKLGWLLGFRNIIYSIPNGGVQTSESIIELNTPRYLYLVVDEFTSSNTNSFISPLPTSIINKNILAKITIDYSHHSFGQVIAANRTNGLLISDKRSYNGKVNLQKLKIQLVNEYGMPVNLNGLDFSFCLEISYE